MGEKMSSQTTQLLKWNSFHEYLQQLAQLLENIPVESVSDT